MRIRLATTLAAALLLSLACTAQARPVAPENLEGLVQKSDLFAVVEVTKIEDLRLEVSERWNTTLQIKRATLRVLRGLRPEDGSPIVPEEITLDYPARHPLFPALPNGPEFPILTERQIALLPLKQTADKRGWQFVSEEDFALVMPAARRPLITPPKTPRDYLVHELTAAFANGDFQNMSAASRYLNQLGKETPAPAIATPDAIFALLRAEVGESGMREDNRWLPIAIAAYNTTAPRPTLAALLSDDAAVEPPLQLARLTLRKSSPRDLDRRILQLLINHQEDPGYAWTTAITLIDNYAGDPTMIAMERSAISDGKPGGMYIADTLIGDVTDPLALTASRAAREILDPQKRPFGGTDPETMRHAISLLLRLGTDDDFAFFISQIRRAREFDTRNYEYFLLGASAQNADPARTCEIARQYIEDATPQSAVMGNPPAGASPFRFCDLAADMTARAAKENFTIKITDPLETRNAAVAKAQAFLKAKQQ